jgi:CIC family chloride channel protein
LTGIFSIADVRDILVERDLDNLLIMKEIADENVTAVEMDENLAGALRKFTEQEVDKLPVVESENSRKILGMIRRRDVISAYYEKISSMQNQD